jgi:hypothetical protein
MSTTSAGRSTPHGRRKFAAIVAPSSGTSMRSAVGSSSLCARASTSIERRV